MEVRPVRPDDNALLIELSRSTHHDGELIFYAERSPDFFSFYNQYGPCLNDWSKEDLESKSPSGWISVCLLQDDRIVGMLTITFRKVWYDNHIIRVLTPLDALVVPELQRQGLFKKIINYLVERWGKGTADVAIGYINRINEPAKRIFTQSHESLLPAQPAGDFRLVQVSMYRPYLNAKIQIERAGQ